MMWITAPKGATRIKQTSCNRLNSKLVNVEKDKDIVTIKTE